MYWNFSNNNKKFNSLPRKRSKEDESHVGESSHKAAHDPVPAQIVHQLIEEISKLKKQTNSCYLLKHPILFTKMNLSEDTIL